MPSETEMTSLPNGVQITNRDIYDKVEAVEETLNTVLRTYVSWKALGALIALITPIVLTTVALWP